MTRLLPTVARMAVSWASMMLSSVQSGRTPAMSNRKCSSTAWPFSVCSTSGWNWTPARRRSRSSNAATGAPADEAVTANPGGGSVTPSPWLIHTDWVAGRSRSSVPPSLMVTWVRPNSRPPVWATRPPRVWAMDWKP